MNYYVYVAGLIYIQNMAKHKKSFRKKKLLGKKKKNNERHAEELKREG